MSLLLLFIGTSGTLQGVAQVLSLSLPTPTLVPGDVVLTPTAQVLALSAPMPTRVEAIQAPTPVLAFSAATPTLVHTAPAILTPTPQVLALSSGTPGLSIDVTVPIFLIGGVIRTDILRKSVSISDQLDEAPNTCALTIDGGPKPIVGQEIKIGIGSLSHLEFAGHLTSVEQTYEGRRALVRWQCEAVDYTRLLDRRFVYARYPSQSATTTVIDLVQRYTSGFSTTGVQTGLPVIDAIDFTWEEPTQALTRLSKLVGGYWYVDYNRAIHFFVTEPTDAPGDITEAQLEVRALANAADLNQVRTRVLVEGYGSTAATDVAPGATAIPVDDAVYYADGAIGSGGDPGSGRGYVKSGPQRIQYQGKAPGGGTSLVQGIDGPAAPPYATIAGGGGGVIGTVFYRVSFKSSAGETLPGGISNPATGVAFAPPPTGPYVQPYGAGPLAGRYRYRVSYLSDRGETLAGDGYGQVDTVAVPPPPSPSVTVNSGRIGPLVGTYTYVCTYVTALGETLAGGTYRRDCYALGSNYGMAGPGQPGAGQAANIWGGLKPGTYTYAATWVTPYGETVIGRTTSAGIASWTPGYPTLNNYGTQPSGQPGLPAGYSYHWAVALVDQDGGVSYLSTNSPALTVSGSPAWCALNIPIGPPGTVARRLYRKVITDTYWRWVADIQDNLATTYTDFNPVVGVVWNGGGTMGGVANVSVGASASDVTAIRIYRSKRNTGGPLYRIAEITPAGYTQTISDETPDSALTEAAPGINAGGGELLTIGIPMGPTGTLARRLYRTKANGGEYHLLVEFGHNGTANYVDWTPDEGLSGGAPPLVPTAGGQGVYLSNLPIGPAGTLARRIYRARRIEGGGYADTYGPYTLVAQLADNAQTTLVDTVADGAGGDAEPLLNEAGASIVQLVNIPIGPAGVIARRIYRTMGGGGIFYFLAEIEDNTTVSLLDDRSDKELGDVAPIVSTLGALPGDTTIRVASTAPFSASGGWVYVGNQTIRYTGLGDHLLTGIPASGEGSITAPIRGDDDILAAAMLLAVPASGEGAILFEIKKGDAVNVLVERNDVAAQQALAAIEGGDGIHEHFVQDNRLSIASCINRGDAELAQFKTAEQRLTFTSRDPKLRSGKTVTVNLGAPTNIAGTFKIQQVTIDGFDIPGQLPWRHVTASNYLYSLEHILRRVLLAGEGAS